MLNSITKSSLNYFIIIVLSFITFWWTFFIFHREFDVGAVLIVILARVFASTILFNDYNLSWSKASTWTFLSKSYVYITAFFISLPFLYRDVHIYFLASELFLYLFVINYLMYSYQAIVNRVRVEKTKTMVIYGAGNSGVRLEREFAHSEYRVVCFCDDDANLQNRSINGLSILSREKLKERFSQTKVDLLIVAIPTLEKSLIRSLYDELQEVAHTIKILPSLEQIFKDDPFSKQLKDIGVEDLLARHPKDLDKTAIRNFLKEKTVLITGAGGSIGSEIVRQCILFDVKKLILVDHSEYNLYAIEQEVEHSEVEVVSVMISVVDKESVQRVFEMHSPQIVIHAAAYKHVPLCEENISQAIKNNIVGTKNIIDIACDAKVQKVVLISTDKAVRPTNVMGTTKRICELYAQNKISQEDKKNNPTEIVAVRFGNVLGSSGSVIPKFKAQLQNGGPITVTHPEITRYFMLIPEACELVLQAGSLGKGGEVFILDMGEPIKIVDLAKKMCELSGKKDIEIKFTGLRTGEKLYEELLLDESEGTTPYESITVGKSTHYDIDKLNSDIAKLLELEGDTKAQLQQLKYIVPEFNHMVNR
ncbi:MAG: polysaccharide biosynthesis protein [Campylobacterales bacterium]|nr:polysaccharide biosynthesis protein [Campylobacterales bacterium]